MHWLNTLHERRVYSTPRELSTRYMTLNRVCATPMSLRIARRALYLRLSTRPKFAVNGGGPVFVEDCQRIYTMPRQSLSTHSEKSMRTSTKHT